MENLRDWVKLLFKMLVVIWVLGFAFIGAVHWYYTVLGGQTIMKNTTRLIAINIGEECEVYSTNAPVKRLLELERESCECCDEFDYESIPAWQSILRSEGYEFDDVDVMYFDVTESRNEWLHTTFNCTEQYEIGYTVDISHEITVYAD